jgi:hypothetical protein
VGTKDFTTALYNLRDSPRSNSIAVEERQMANLRVRLLAAATVNGKRSYYKPAMRSTGWPDGGAVLVKGRRVRIDASQQTTADQ